MLASAQLFAVVEKSVTAIMNEQTNDFIT